MVSIKIIKGDGTEATVTARTNGEAFDKADEMGALKIVDCYGESFLKIDGEWVGFPQKATTAGD